MRKVPKEINIELISKHVNYDRPNLNSQDSISSASGTYNDEKIPPNFSLAVSHGLAYKISRPKEGITAQLCPCCKLPVNCEPTPLTCNLESFYQVGTYHLGSGYALYFHFLKYCIILLLLLLSISGVYNMVTNIMEGDCDAVDTFCSLDWVTFMTLANKRDSAEQLSIQLYLNLAAMVVIMLFFHYMRYQMRKIDKEVDKRATTPSDYTIKMTRVPVDTTNTQIRSWFEGFSTMVTPIKCVKIVRTYETKAMNSLEIKRKEIARRYTGNRGHIQQVLLQLELTKLQGELNKNLNNKNTNYTPAVYVIFEKQSMPEFLLNNLKAKNESCWSWFNPFEKALYDMKEAKVNIKRAPEPGDILWKNLGYGVTQKRKSRFITTFCTIVILLLGFSLILGVYWAQKQLRDDLTTNEWTLRILLIVGSLLIASINTVLSMVIGILTTFEMHGTRTGYSTALARKIALALLFNTGFISLIATIVLSDHFSWSFNLLGTLNGLNVYGPDGLVKNMFYVFLLNIIYPAIITMVDIPYFLRVRSRKKTVLLGESAAMTQRTANLLFQGSQPNMSTKYASVIKTMLVTSFYAPVMPIVLVLSLIGLVIIYWCDKYLFLRRYALPPAMPNQLNNSMMEHIDQMALTFALGNVIFMASLVQSNGELSYTVNSSNIIVMLVTLGIALVHAFIPMRLVNSALFKIKILTSQTISYDEARVDFHTDYDLENPATKHQMFEEKLDASSSGISRRNTSFCSLDSKIKDKLGDSILSNFLNKMDWENPSDQ